MRIYEFAVIFLIVLAFRHNEARQHYNQNTDFLLHEAGGSPPAPKRDYVAPQTSTTKKSDFPPLGPSLSTVTTPRPLSTPQATRPTQPGGKRDYVAQNFPPLNPPSNSQTGKNIGSSSLGPSMSTHTTPRPMPSPQPTRPTQTTGKRDYVAPNFPSTKPTPGSGKVKDLISFFDNNDKQTNNSPKVPSYSSILQGSTSKTQNTATQSTTKAISNQTLKPISFSAIVAGTNNKATTSKPSTNAFSTPLRPVNNNNLAPTSRPLVLPSSVTNGNRGNNGNSPSDAELQILSEELLRRDTNNAAKYVTINYQEKTTSHSTEDKAPQPLLIVSPEAWNIPTIQKILPLLDNYERDTLVNEYVTPQERNEENAFMDAVMSTSVIRHLMNFLKDKGYVSPDPQKQRDFLKQMWFGLYSRGKGKLSSSGFEHIFVSELKNSQVSGLHNWIYFAREEQANRLNYLGYLKYSDLGDKGAVLKLHLNQQGVDKPVDAIFIGTSPELEMSLYTLCFVTRVDNDCNLKLAGKDVNVQTYNYRYRSKNYIGSGFPQI